MEVDGRAWGDQQFALEFARSGFDFHGLSSQQRRELADRHPAADSDTTSLRWQTEVAQVAIPIEDPQRYAVGGIYTPLINYHCDGVDIAGEGFRASLDWSQQQWRGRLLCADECKLARLSVVDNYLRIASAYGSLQQGGLVLHSAGLVFEQRAWLFLGRSGAGKSTISGLGLQAGADLLSDDCNILLPNSDGGFNAVSVPLAGDLCAQALPPTSSFPLAGIYWLEQGASLQLRDIGSGAQLAKVLACASVLNADPYRLERAMDVIGQLLHTQALRELQFLRDSDFTQIQHLLLEH